MTNNKAASCCPACGNESHYLIDWEYSGLNNSIFNYTAKFFACLYCGLVYIDNISDEMLSTFYADECSYFEKSHFNISAPENWEKYKTYREILVDAGLAGTSITDIGCGRGGFLIWLQHNAWQADCRGVDIDLQSIPEVQANTGAGGMRLTFQEGGALALPFAAGTQALLTYFHVLEHIRNLDNLFSEAFRVLHDTGHILLEVPDAASNYDAKESSDSAWLVVTWDSRPVQPQ